MGFAANFSVALLYDYDLQKRKKKNSPNVYKFDAYDENTIQNFKGNLINWIKYMVDVGASAVWHT